MLLKRERSSLRESREIVPSISEWLRKLFKGRDSWHCFLIQKSDRILREAKSLPFLRRFSMKVILLKDVSNIGKTGEVKNVSDGYGRNFLIPKGFAVEANAKELAKLKQIQKQKEEKEERIRKSSEDLLHELQKHHFIIKAKSGTSGKLFGAVTSGDIANHIRNSLGVEIDKKEIDLGDHIKQTGEYRVDIKLPGNVKGKIALKVEGLEEE